MIYFFRRFSVFYNIFRPTWPSSDNETKYRIRGRQLSPQNIINYFDNFLPSILYANALPIDGEVGRSTKSMEFFLSLMADFITFDILSQLDVQVKSYFAGRIKPETRFWNK